MAQALRFDGELAGQLIARAPRWIMGLLVVLLGIRAALLVAELAGPAAVEALPAAPAAAPPTRNVIDVPSILRANLFGQSAPPAGAAGAPVTSMALLLAGVIASPDEKAGFAMLGTSAADIKFYKVGDSIPGGAQLHAVHVDRVLVNRGGTIEAVILPPRSNATLAAPPPIAPAAATSVQRVQQVMRENPAILGQVIQRQAVFADGKLRGMRVYPGGNAAAFNKLGLRPGDLITAVNGTALNDQTRSSEIFDTLSSAAEARVTVQRNGSTQDLVLNLAEVANEAERLSQAPPPDAPAGDSPLPPDSAR